MNFYVIYGFDKEIRLCPFCEKAKNLIEEKNDTFFFNNVVYNSSNSNKEEVDNHRKIMLELLERDSIKGLTFPQIFKGKLDPDTRELTMDIHIGGFSELKKMYEETEKEDFSELL